MKTLSLIIVLAAVFICFAPIAFSQQTPPNNHIKPNKTMSPQAKENDTATKGGTTLLQIDTNKDSGQGDDTRTKEHKWYKPFTTHPTEWLLVLFTLILAIATGF